MTALVQLEDGQKRHYRHILGGPGHKLRETQVLGRANALMNGAHVHLHGNGLGGNVLAFQQEHLTARKGRGRLIGQRVQRHPFQEVRHEAEEVGIRGRRGACACDPRR